MLLSARRLSQSPQDKLIRPVGPDWGAAAAQARDELNVPITVRVVGPGMAVRDAYGTWREAPEIDETGAVLVRPDHHVARRSISARQTGIN